MTVLVDTNVLVYFLYGNYDKFSRQTLRLLRQESTQIQVSILALWELGTKQASGRIDFRFEQIQLGLQSMGATLLLLRPDHVAEYYRLKFQPKHRDPFDRMLIAQAIAEQIPVVTNDTRFSTYPGLRVIW